MDVTIKFPAVFGQRSAVTVTMPKTSSVFDLGLVVCGLCPNIKTQCVRVLKDGVTAPCMHIVLSPPLVNPPTCPEEDGRVLARLQNQEALEPWLVDGTATVVLMM